MAEKVLLLSGPQHWDKRRPITGLMRRYAENLNPLGISIVSRLLKNEGYETSYMVMEPNKVSKLEPIIDKFKGVFISSRAFDTDLTYQVVQMANMKNIPVVVGGYSPTLTPKLFPNATKVLGEFEPVANQVIQDFRSRRFDEVYDARTLPPFDMSRDYVWPDRSIFPERNSLSRLPQEWERGCTNYCSFCSPVVMQRGGSEKAVRERNPDDIIRELKEMNIDGGNLFLTDLNTTRMRRETLIQLLPYLKSKNIKWYTEGTVLPLLDDLEKYGEENSLLRMMSPLNGEGGCYSFLYGADDLVAEKVKGARDKEIGLIAKATQTFKRFGIPLNLSVVVGLENHTYPDSFFTIRNTLEEVRAPYTFIHLATPYIGTAWGNTVLKEDRYHPNIKSTDLNHRKVVFDHKNMTTDQLQQGYYWLQRSMTSFKNSLGSIRNNFEMKFFENNIFLGLLNTGVFWDFETNLSIGELWSRGYLIKARQSELDAEYRNWLRK